jgi:hypothetical protein
MNSVRLKTQTMPDIKQVIAEPPNNALVRTGERSWCLVQAYLPPHNFTVMPLQ